MASVNKAIVVGSLGKDPEMRYLPNGDAVCNFSVATSESWKDKTTGDKKEATEWHRINFFGKLAEVCGQYLKKGSLVYIDGSIHTRKWKDKDGTDRYSTEIKGQSMQMLGGKKESSGDTTSDKPKDESSRPPSGFEDFPDDIPY